jgi:RND family efflux transporter MFP subunit
MENYTAVLPSEGSIVMKKLIHISLIALVGAFAIPIGCQEAPQAPPAPVPKVSVANPEVRDLAQYDEYNGWIGAEQTVEVRARVRGHIQSVKFTDGQLVNKDQLLFELDPRPFQADINRATDQLHVYQAQLVSAQKEETRLKELLSKGGSSQSQVDKAEADRIALEAEIEGAKHEVDRITLDLDYSKITAPIAGRISRAQLTVGNLVNAGGSDPVLTTIVSVDPIYIYFSVDERAIQRYMRMRAVKFPEGEPRSGNIADAKLPFDFALETDNGYPNHGTLNFVDNQIDQQTGSVTVRGVVPNPEGLFLPGSRVKIRVPIGEPTQTILVPDTAVLSDQDKKYVLVIDDKNVVHRRDIDPGRLLDDGMRIVLPGENGRGLSESDKVIVLGIQSARVNYPVDPVAATTQPATAMANEPAIVVSDARGGS